MVELVRELQRQILDVERRIRAARGERISNPQLLEAVRAAVDYYFRTVREPLSSLASASDALATADTVMHSLLEATHGRSRVSTYRTALTQSRRILVTLERLALTAHTGTPLRPALHRVDERIIATLRDLLPSAAAAYEQGVLDLQAPQRLSWRGPATDLREALRETLDHLAPDREVMAQAGYRPEPNTNGPTMRQKVRYVLRSRGLSRSSMQAPESAVDAVEEAVGTFVRSVYTRSNVSTHTPTDKREVLRVRDWVRVGLCELLEVEG